MNKGCKVFIALFIGFSLVPEIKAQGFLHTESKKIVDGNEEEIILRGIGTGNWMLQEGYMMQTSDIAGTQHEFRSKLVETIGEIKTDSFYNAWLASHFTESDVQSMKLWGFNCVRVAMHYKWFTPPIGDEPVPGEITWIDKGFDMIDSLLDWCGRSEMYLILDLHGAPGGQGKDANISDYDSTKPSLWESDDNKEKTVALWRKLAERYSGESWMGGYDLINETNWTFPEGNNSQLRNLYEDITAAVREVDTNHIIFIEGNWFANDFGGLTPPWDNNMAYSFHKYWSYNDENSLDWVINLRNQYNIPIWLGEAGENSNTWFTNLISLCEINNIGWAWWPVKKPGINNPLRVEVNPSYLDLIDYWKGQAPQPSEEDAFQAVLQFADNHRIENCHYQHNVVDAMIRQSQTRETIPFKNHSTNQIIYATDYDLGRNGYAYFDEDTANYRVSTNIYTAWNRGWSYRNDGVDIEECNDNDSTNGYNVGWISDHEWIQYTIESDSLAAYTLTLRFSSLSGGAKIQILNNKTPITKSIILPSTGSWQNWNTVNAEGIIVPEGTSRIRVYMENGGFNLNYLSFSEPVSVDSIDFIPLYASSSLDGNSVFLTLNKEITSSADSIKVSDFNIISDGIPLTISDVIINPAQSCQLIIELLDPVYYGTTNSITYYGQQIFHNTQLLEPFGDLEVINKLPARFTLPGRIEAENFQANNGFELEQCQDINGGYNTAYANSGDYLDYFVHVLEEGYYKLNYRVATIRTNAELMLWTGSVGSFTPRDTILFKSTGDWQNWETQSSEVYLEEGRYILRLQVKQGEHNLNWFEILEHTGINTRENPGNELIIWPNPAGDYLFIELADPITGLFICSLHNLSGTLIKSTFESDTRFVTMNLSDLEQSVYFLTVTDGLSMFKPMKLIKY